MSDELTADPTCPKCGGTRYWDVRYVPSRKKTWFLSEVKEHISARCMICFYRRKMEVGVYRFTRVGD